MILDSSAILAILLQEPGWEKLLDRIGAEPAVAVGAPTLVETGIVLSSRLGRNARPILNDFVRESDIEVISFGREHFEAAMGAFSLYGKGRHKAALNFGDCMSYAMAHVAGMPLLYTGNDFSRTDLRRPDAEN
ncbi:MAG: type II toxin-antitoxin system VapC family toxin [Acidobacteriales bacterium]|nr:type II toxin-antitoxin system VapC family toxin [Terriglobales bacterium]